MPDQTTSRDVLLIQKNRAGGLDGTIWGPNGHQIMPTDAGLAPVGGGGPTYTSNSVLNNFNLTNTTVIRRMIADARAGYARSRLLVVGMSTEAGAGSVSATLYGGNNRSKSWPMLLANMFKNAGINANADYIVGGGNKAAAALPTFDTRVAFTNTAESLAVQLWGGPSFQMTASTGQIVFTPTNSFDRIMIASASSGGNSVITAVGNGGATSGTLNTSGAAGVVYADNACSAGSTVATLTCGTGGGAFPFLIGTRDSTKPGLEVINGGWGGSGTPDWNSAAAWNCNQAFDAILDTNALNCTIFCLDINDAYFGVAPATYRANLNALLAKLQSKGDVIVKISPNVGLATVSQAVQDTYWSIAVAAANAAGVPWVDMRAATPDRATSLSLGIARDDLHETARGYSTEASVMFRALTYMA
jgi:lysophospholipase L1-like esterase